MGCDKVFIWLQDDEGEGVADCGCKLVREWDDGNPAFIMCAMHLAATKKLPSMVAPSPARYVIYSSGEDGYWDNENGWLDAVYLERAGTMIFSQAQKDTFHLPIAEGVQWKKLTGGA